MSDALASIVAQGLIKGESGRAFFSSIHGVYRYGEYWGLVEVIVNSNHHQLASTFDTDKYVYKDAALPDSHPGFVDAMEKFKQKFRDIDPGHLHTSRKMEVERDEYWKGVAAHTRRSGSARRIASQPANFEVNLPLPIGFAGALIFTFGLFCSLVSKFSKKVNSGNVFIPSARRE
jgi:hypothetical protein